MLHFILTRQLSPDPFKVHDPLGIKTIERMCASISFPVSVGHGSKIENEKNLEIEICAKHAETETPGTKEHPTRINPSATQRPLPAID